MGLKDRIRPHVINKIGDGMNTSLWYDRWGDHELIDKIVPKAHKYVARFGGDTTVVDMINEGNWQWPSGWCQVFPQLETIDVPEVKENVVDKVQWQKSNGEVTKFSIKTVWEYLRTKGQKVKWSNMVWY